jgi:hypothetical protein
MDSTASNGLPMNPNLELDLLKNDRITNKCKHSKIYSQNLYAALCNNRFFYGDKEWTCSWRYAGGIVSIINGGQDYMDYYCSGMSDIDGFVNESVITEEIRLDILTLGWVIKPYDN